LQLESVTETEGSHGKHRQPCRFWHVEISSKTLAQAQYLLIPCSRDVDCRKQFEIMFYNFEAGETADQQLFH
jgi:hypothetical protein